MTETVRVPMTVEQRAEKADEMARLLARITGVESEAKEAARGYREEMQALEAQLRVLGLAVQEGVEHRAQMDLTFPEEQAAQALHDVVEHAECTCVGGPEAEVKAPACPVHGVDAQAPKPDPCDGNHQAPECGRPECWLVVGAEEWAAANATSGPETPQETADGAETMSEPQELASGPDSGEPATEDPAGAEAEAPHEAEVDLDEKFPREDLEAAVAANAVDVGTVEEPPTVAAHRAKRRRSRLTESDAPQVA